MPTDVPKSETGAGEPDTPTSSIDVPLLYKELSSYISTPFRKDSGSHSPNTSGTIGEQKSKSQSVQQIIGQRVVDTVQVRRSHSTAHRMMKLPKSMFKGSRTVDPKLKITPFRSRVTFSEDTKTNETEDLTKLYYFIPKSQTDSSSDMSDIFDSDPKVVFSESPQYATPHLIVEIPDIIDKKNDSAMRRQSLDPAKIIIPEASTSQEEEKWLHHQSLPNIQEGQEEETHNEVQTSPSLARKVSVKRHTSDRTTERRRSFKRQICSCQEPQQDTGQEQEFGNIEDDEDSDEKAKHDLVSTPNLKKKRKEAKPRQSSTESDTGSYHTACSFLMQISEDAEDIPEMLQTSNSSIESYTSATDEPKGSQNNLLDPNLGSKLPKITVTQLTPSITSLSSDGLNSTKGTQNEKNNKNNKNKNKRVKSEELDLNGSPKQSLKRSVSRDFPDKT